MNASADIWALCLCKRIDIVSPSIRNVVNYIGNNVFPEAEVKNAACCARIRQLMRAIKLLTSTSIKLYDEKSHEVRAIPLVRFRVTLPTDPSEEKVSYR